MELGISSVSACVKVDDTTTGIEEGLRAGMWTVGVVMTGNEVGLPEADLAALPVDIREARRIAGYARLRAAGAHEVIDGIADLPALLDQVPFRRTVDAKSTTPGPRPGAGASA
jgi:phosphonoacetaldehyde hydrolase